MENKSGGKKGVESHRSTQPRCPREGLGTCCSWTTEPQYLGNQITAAVKSSRWFWLCQQCLRPFLCLGTHTHRLGRTHTHKKRTSNTLIHAHTRSPWRDCVFVCVLRGGMHRSGTLQKVLSPSMATARRINSAFILIIVNQKVKVKAHCHIWSEQRKIV